MSEVATLSPPATPAASPPPVRLVYKGGTVELTLDCLSAPDCIAILQALGVGGAPAAAPAPAPRMVEAMPPPAPAAPALRAEPRPESSPAPGRRGRKQVVADWVAKQHSVISTRQIHEAFADEFPSQGALAQFMAKWLTEPDCALVRVGRGYYRARRPGDEGGGAAAATAGFRGASCDPLADGARPGGSEVGASGA